MAKKKPAPPKTRQPKSFTGLLNEQAKSVQALARAVRKVIYEEVPARKVFTAAGMPWRCIAATPKCAGCSR